jgi:hypothetical protein
MHQELRDKQTDSIILDQRLYQNLKIEYNYYIQTFRHHLDIIKSNVNSLSQLSFTLLDNFFKRKATNVELKQYSCHVCSAQLSTEKILKTHLKKQHGNILPPKSNTPLVASVVYNPIGRPKGSDQTPKPKRIRKKKANNEISNSDQENQENQEKSDQENQEKSDQETQEKSDQENQEKSEQEDLNQKSDPEDLDQKSSEPIQIIKF